jgi:hypothetical protein
MPQFLKHHCLPKIHTGWQANMRTFKSEGRDIYDESQMTRIAAEWTNQEYLGGRSLSVAKKGGICKSSGKLE